jgi:sigma-54 dependent transcriptional regulator, flagellar regulatory protein
MLDQRFPWARFYELKHPVQFDDLGTLLDEIWVSHSHHREDRSADDNNDRLIGDSAEMHNIRSLIDRVAPSMATVLVTGESGTGKEVVARRIHQLSGRSGPFVAINCGAIPDHLLESELFGHERGAFTGAVASRAGRFEIAKGGTIFLDEIGDMPAGMQVKLLRVLQERVVERIGGTSSTPVDVRVIAATHRNLSVSIEEGQFREDLYYRLSVFPIEVPPLRARVDDIRPLVDEITDRVYRSHGIRLHIAEPAMQILCKYEWPGNVRELANLIERLAIIRPVGVIQASDLPWPLRGTDAQPAVVSSTLAPVGANDQVSLPSTGLDLKKHLAMVEKELIEAALAQCKGIVQQAADLLGMGRTTLAEKIRRHGIHT